jgi:hypothetical protein
LEHWLAVLRVGIAIKGTGNGTTFARIVIQVETQEADRPFDKMVTAWFPQDL